MKQTIRAYTFETNSSSTHTLCIISEEDYLKAKESGEDIYLYFEGKEPKVLTKEDIQNTSEFIEWIDERVCEYREIEEETEDFVRSWEEIIDYLGVGVDEFIEDSGYYYAEIPWEKFDQPPQTGKVMSLDYTDVIEINVGGKRVYAVYSYTYDA